MKYIWKIIIAIIAIVGAALLINATTEKTNNVSIIDNLVNLFRTATTSQGARVQQSHISTSIGFVQPNEKINIESQDYIDKYIFWNFTQSNRTLWYANFTFNQTFWNDAKNCIAINTNGCWNNLKNTYLPSFTAAKVKADLQNLINYPLKVTAGDWNLTNYNINLTSGTGSFYITTSNGLIDKSKAKLGFNSTSINTTSETSPFEPHAKSICRTTNAVHVVYADLLRVRYTNSTNGTLWNNMTSLDGTPTGDDLSTVNIPTMACKGNSVIVFWANDSAVLYRNSTDEGSTWSPLTNNKATTWTMNFQNNNPTSNALSAAFGANNNVWLAYRYTINTSFKYGTNISNSTLYGGNRPTTNESVLTDPFYSFASVQPDIYVNVSSSTGKEEIFVALRDATGNVGTFFNASYDSGVTYSNYTISKSSPPAGEFAMAVMNYTIYVVINNNTQQNITLFNSTDNGKTWSSGFTVDNKTTPNNVSYPTVVGDDATGNLYVLWAANSTASTSSNAKSYWNIYYRKWNVTNQWDNVVAWQYINSTLAPQINCKFNTTGGLLECVFLNRTGGNMAASSGNGNITYDFINVTVNVTAAAINPCIAGASSNFTNCLLTTNDPISSNAKLAANVSVTNATNSTAITWAALGSAGLFYWNPPFGNHTIYNVSSGFRSPGFVLVNGSWNFSLSTWAVGGVLDVCYVDVWAFKGNSSGQFNITAGAASNANQITPTFATAGTNACTSTSQTSVNITNISSSIAYSDRTNLTSDSDYIGVIIGLRLLGLTAGGSMEYIVNSTDSWVQFPNQTVNVTAIARDTCTYNSGNWLVTCSDACTISANTDLNNNNLVFTGSGLFTVNANITNIKRVELSSACTIAVKQGNYMSVKSS